MSSDIRRGTPQKSVEEAKPTTSNTPISTLGRLVTSTNEKGIGSLLARDSTARAVFPVTE
jgi:hypothetical protein